MPSFRAQLLGCCLIVPTLCIAILIWAMIQDNVALIVTSTFMSITACFIWSYCAWEPPSESTEDPVLTPLTNSETPKSINSRSNSMRQTEAAHLSLDSFRAKLLVHGYISMGYPDKSESIPNEIIGEIFRWYFEEGMGYMEILDILLNQECNIIVYNTESNGWIPAVYIRHFERTQRIMVEYLWEKTVGGSRWHILKDFPTNYVRIQNKRV